MSELPDCESRYQDAWGRVWRCELKWGHGLESPRTPVIHHAAIPDDLRYLYNTLRDRIQWEPGHALPVSNLTW